MIKIITICDSFKHFEEPIKEYKKRLGRKVEILKLKPSKKDNIDEVIKEETKTIIEKLSKINAFKIVLSISGKTFSTQEFLNFVEYKFQNFPEIIFIIGGPYGLDYKELKKHIDFEISFSPMTFPHIEALLILLEQLYRIETIKQGKTYHY
ncbi:MAG: 23S rRNA (pseudouridine(1915)-N(3))-methyltransferase RlmH [Candidatus Gracilibacteria bacterium]|nr:23S rRNA (pseudouridine(1915)-N(3))-methyltransferase RlmH [Candidatus Gracilibacteria bacterium]